MEDLLPEARDPKTPPARLRQIVQQCIYRDRSEELMRAAAANPSTPPEALRWLLATCTGEVLQNPAFPLVLLEDPAFVSQTPDDAALQVLRRGDLAAHLAVLFTQHPTPRVAQAALLHVAVAGEAGADWRDRFVLIIADQLVGESPEVLELAELGIAPIWLLVRLAGVHHSRVRRAALRGLETLAADESHAPGSPAMARNWMELLRSAAGDRELRSISDPDPHIGPDALTAISRGELWARLLAARHVNTPPEVLRRLVDDLHRTVRHRVLRNPSVPVDVLERFAASTDAFDRQAVARNPALTPEIRGRLVLDAAANTRAAVARIPALEPSELHVLAQDPAPEVRAAVARHPRTPLDDLERLAGDGDLPVRLCVAANASTPPHVLDLLAEVPLLRMERVLRRRTDLGPRLQSRLDKGLATSSVPAPPRDGDGMPSQGDAGTPAAPLAPAEDPHSPAELLVQLAGSASIDTRKQVAGNPSIPAAAVERLLLDDNWSIQHTLAGNRRLTTNDLERLVQRQLSIDISERVAQHRSATPELLARLARQTYWLVRLAVAQHPHTPPEVLLQLAADDVSDVRRAVLRRSDLPPGALEGSREAAIRKRAASKDRLYRFITLSHPGLPAEDQAQEAESVEWMDRMALALNPSATREALERLATDGNCLVRAAAREAVAGRRWSAAERDSRMLQQMWGYEP